jgi:hypothetical protein
MHRIYVVWATSAVRVLHVGNMKFNTRIDEFNVHGYVHRNNILVYNSNKMHKTQSLLYLTIALRVSGVTITHLQEHKTTVTTASGNRYTVLLSAAIVEELELI